MEETKTVRTELTVEELEMEREKAMKELIRRDEEKKDTDQIKMIEDFKKMLGVGKTPVSRKDRQNVFEVAMKEAENMLYSCTIKTPQEIAGLFGVEMVPGEKIRPEYTNYYWHVNFPYSRNKIPLPLEIEKPMRRNKKTGKLEEYHFTVTRFYASEDFVKKCNDYFKDYNIRITFQQVYNNPRYKNNWRIELILQEDGIVDFTNVKPVENCSVIAEPSDGEEE